LLPAFFAYTGLRTQIGLVSGRDQWLACGLIILVASLGKFGGSSVAARISGLSWRQASALGILMNTRGLMELIVLTSLSTWGCDYAYPLRDARVDGHRNYSIYHTHLARPKNQRRR
jgi:Kef-type K+ transport system membrane component KefB